VRIKGVAGSRGVQIELFTVRAPRSARVVVPVHRARLPAALAAAQPPGRPAAVRALQRSLRVGAVIETFITRRGTYGRYTRLVIRPNGEPRRTTRCVLHGSRSPMRCPAT
jgi:hypothetical protein